jgi:hypothetical protein
MQVTAATVQTDVHKCTSLTRRINMRSLSFYGSAHKNVWEPLGDVLFKKILAL